MNKCKNCNCVNFLNEDGLCDSCYKLEVFLLNNLSKSKKLVKKIQMGACNCELCGILDFKNDFFNVGGLPICLNCFEYLANKQEKEFVRIYK